MHSAGSDQEDQILLTLTELLAATDDLRRRLGELLDTAPMKNLRRARGLSYGEIMPLGKRLQVIELISEAYKSVNDAAARFRQAEVSALYDEGMTMDEIASVLGVTRQRVSALLRQASRPNRRPGRYPSSSRAAQPGTRISPRDNGSSGDVLDRQSHE